MWRPSDHSTGAEYLVDRFLFGANPVYMGMHITLNDTARAVLDRPHLAMIATSNANRSRR